jgi:hypothetical protein
MVSIVATWDRRNGDAEIHLVIERGSIPDNDRRAAISARVEELEAREEAEYVEVFVSQAPSLESFRATDPRFFEATVVGGTP